MLQSLLTDRDRTFNLATIASVGTLILSTVLAPLQSFLDTVPLDLAQWSVCVAVAASVVVISEIAKALARRTAAAS
jgi:Ca2+-transporting ATPase